ncbi:hypothetical protein [Pseudomonas syringae group genomosp. 3]|uniref:hypothetical protein n=1 Tax=Pseudomonas syringae group genomosp. 3 TaxID=251701 RepID=UPI0001E2982C|nr:hypothetical protein [Pseudomonas syringae group genomosp. 3]
MTIDWSKAPAGTTGAMVAGFNGATVKRGDIEWIPSSTTPKGQYQVGAGAWAYHEAPQSWSGEGMPPAGARVERAFSHSTWKLTTICGHSTDGAYASFYDGDGLMGWADKCKLRPIRTAEKIEADQKNQEIQELMIILGSVESAAYKDIAIAIQQANFRKQVSQ